MLNNVKHVNKYNTTILFGSGAKYQEALVHDK